MCHPEDKSLLFPEIKSHNRTLRNIAKVTRPCGALPKRYLLLNHELEFPLLAANDAGFYTKTCFKMVILEKTEELTPKNWFISENFPYPCFIAKKKLQSKLSRPIIIT